MEINDAEYEAKMKKAKVYYRQVLTAVKNFSPDNMTSILDCHDFQGNLRQVRDKFLQASAWSTLSSWT